MGLPSVLIAYITVYIQDAAAVKMHGFFGGYNNIVWTVIIVQAVGGLIVATVVKVCFFSPTFNFFRNCIGSHSVCVVSFLSNSVSVRGQCIESLCNIIFDYYFLHHFCILV